MKNLTFASSFFHGPFLLSTLVILLSLPSQGFFWKNKSSSKNLNSSDKVSIMTFNVENLFDNIDDPGKDDKAYLPISKKKSRQHIKECKKISVYPWRKDCLDKDWSDKNLRKKMQRLAAVIKQINHGQGPDILLLQEVENMRVLEIFRKTYLQASEYNKSILIEGKDNRGIDTAILTRLELAGKPKLHQVPYKAEGSILKSHKLTNTRGVLEAPLRLPNGDTLHVYSLHFHSAGKPTYTRVQASEYLNTLLDRVPKGHYAIAGGDFNINRGENDIAKIYEKTLSPKWHVSHLVGCKKCRGSNYYHKKRQWSFLDAILFSREEFDPENESGWVLNPKSIRIANKSEYQINRFGSPARFDANKGSGVSDHWPIYAEIINLQKKNLSYNN